MLSISEISGAEYFLGGGGSSCAHVHERSADYELAAIAGGEPPGQWVWRGENALGQEGVIVPKRVSGEAFRLVVNELRNPGAAKQWEADRTPSGNRKKSGTMRHPRLGRAPQGFKTVDERVEAWQRKHPDATTEEIAAYRVEASADQKSAKRAWDLTFSPPKSWSVAWAALKWAGRDAEADALWECWEAGVQAALDQLYEEHAYIQSRPTGPADADGRRTARYKRAQNLQMAMFRHHVSREGDPQLHVHVTLVNRALDEEGRWRALYSPAFYTSKHTMDVTCRRTAEMEATRRLGLRFLTDPETGIREVEGVSRGAREFFSCRSRQLDGWAEEEAEQFRKVQGREPNRRERYWIRQRATLGSREAKPKDPPSIPERVERWQEDFSRATRESLAEVRDGVDAARAGPGEPIVVPGFDPDAVIELALADMTGEDSVWSSSKLAGRIDAHLPDMLATEAPRELVAGLVERALASAAVRSVEASAAVSVPSSMRDARTGRSEFAPPDARKFTTATTVERERSLVARLDLRTNRLVPQGTARALLDGRGLSVEQRDLAADVLSSGRWLELVDAAAGTGKSTTMRGLSQAATQQWGVGVVGVTVAENPAQVLRGQGVARAFNVAALLDFQDRESRGEVSDHERATFAIAPGSILALDEASTFDTATLTRLVDVAWRLRVGKVLLVGDREQADPVDAGGTFALLVDELERRRRDHVRRERATEPAQRGANPTPAPVLRLTEVRRFSNRWECDASTRLRARDVTALHQYDVRGRLHGDTDRERLRDAAVTAFVDDYTLGDSILVTATTKEAAEAADLARHKLVALGRVEQAGVMLADKNLAGVGDLIQTRENDRDVGVVNRQRWGVVGRGGDGSLTARPEMGRDDHGEQVWGPERSLPASYVASQVELAYAATVHAFEGSTVKGSAHTLVSRQMGFAHVYVGGTRGTEANHLWVELAPDFELERARAKVTALEHRSVETSTVAARASVDVALAEARRDVEELEPRAETPMGRLASVVTTREHRPSALSAINTAEDAAGSLARLGPEWETMIRESQACAHRSMLFASLHPDDARAVVEDPAVAKLYGLMRGAETSGHEPGEVLSAVAAKGRLTGANSAASVLYKRVKDEMGTGPLGRPVPVSFMSRTPTPSLGDRRNELLDAALERARALDARTAELGRRTALDEPAWAVTAMGPVPDAPDARMGWGARLALAAAYRERYGVDDPRRPLGQRPEHSDPERSWLWDVAMRSMGVPEDQRALAAATDAELHRRVESWERVLAWMPDNVDDELCTAHAALQEARHQEVEVRTSGADPLDAEATVLEMRERVGMLEEIARVRAAAYERHDGTRVAASDARGELGRRGWVPPVSVTIPAPREPESEREVGQEVSPEPSWGEVDTHAAVLDRWTRNLDVEHPVVFGSREWALLEDDDPAKRAAVTAAAIRMWAWGEPADDKREVDERLSVRDSELPEDDPDVESLTRTYLWSSTYLQVEGPEFGTDEWARLDDEDLAKDAGEAVAALRWWNGGDDLDSRRERARETDEAARQADLERLRDDPDPDLAEVAQEASRPDPKQEMDEFDIAEGEPESAGPAPMADDAERKPWQWALDAAEVARAPRPEPEPTPAERLQANLERARAVAQELADEDAQANLDEPMTPEPDPEFGDRELVDD